MLAQLNRLMALMALCGLLAWPVQAQTKAEQGDSLEVGNREAEKPIDFVPLAVGNRWTYKHWYWGGDYSYENSVELTIEITHTETIDGFRYFVFSHADYDCASIPIPFWAGQKVRLTDEDVLLFRWNGQDVPVYAFPQQHNEISYRFYFDNGHYSGLRSGHRQTQVLFVTGYGLAGCMIYETFLGFGDQLLNDISPISALIDGEEVLYEQTGGPILTDALHVGMGWLNFFFESPSESLSSSSVQSTSWGQVKAR